jgi:hypothetical protein
VNRQFENVLNDCDGALCELQPGELADVNGGLLIFTSAVLPYWWVPTLPVGPQHGPVLPVVTLPAGQPMTPPFTT